MADLTFTTVIHPIRRELGLSFLQFALADSIYHLSHGGWCFASRSYFGTLFDCNRTTIIRNIAVLEEKGLIERDPSTDYLRTTEIWRDTVIFREQNLLAARLGTLSQNATPPVAKRDTPLSQNATPPCRKMQHNKDNNDIERITDSDSPHSIAAATKIPPSLEDVLEYFRTRGPARGLAESLCATEAEKYWNHNVNAKWRLSGGRGAVIKNWYLSCNTWIANAISYQEGRTKTPKKKTAGSNMSSLHNLFDTEAYG